jgi:NAD(P)-dependent dehydrogenase (short-subunit alcohol dehydrogenase family)
MTDWTGNYTPSSIIQSWQSKLSSRSTTTKQKTNQNKKNNNNNNNKSERKNKGENDMSEQNKSSSSKIAIVTGGSRGIGRNTVESLAKNGVRSIFTYNTHSADADAVVAAVKEAGSQAIALQLDAGCVSSFDAFVESVKEALAKLGATHFDFLVNNAGNNHKNMAFEKVTEEELDSVYSVHFKGVLFLSQKLLPLINDGGRIINVSTARTRIAHPGGSAYASMKGAVEVLSKHMAKELGARKITVNVVAPGAVATDFSGGIVRDNPEVNKMVKEATALGRVAGPEDIGPVIASLLSEGNGWINAQRIEASGGVVI